MAEKQVAEEKISKALEQLQDLAKGHASGSAPSTKVETMREPEGATQVYHTPSNSDPNGWAGSTWKESPKDDSVDANGTDYKGGAKMMKSILAKLAKGLPLNADEASFYASIAKGDFDMDDKDDKKMDKAHAEPDKDDVKKGEDEEEPDEDDKEKMGKSLTDHARENEDVQKGLELSSFLEGWARVQDNALTSTEGRILNQVRKSLSNVVDRQESFNGELAKSIAALAEVMTLQSQRIEQLESTPARAPKSQVQVVNKSFVAGGPATDGEQLTKSDILKTMTDMVQKSLLSATEVVKFESTNVLPSDIEHKVRAHRAGR